MASREEYQQRVRDEAHELRVKIDKLWTFISSNKTFDTLPSDEQHRLRKQFDLMIQYAAVLQERIDHFQP